MKTTAACLLLFLSLTAHTQSMDAEGPPVALLPDGGDAAAGSRLLESNKAPAMQAGTPIIVNAEINPQTGTATLTNIPAETASRSLSWSGYAAVEATAANGNPDLALQQLNTRLNQAPDDAKAAYLKGLILMQLGRTDNAERWFKMMQANFPDLPQPYNALAVIYTGRGDLLLAEQSLQTLLSKHPDNRTAQINLANIYVKLARENYSKALKTNPDDAMIAGKLKTLETLDK